jgi:hypothetical protein
MTIPLRGFVMRSFCFLVLAVGCSIGTAQEPPANEQMIEVLKVRFQNKYKSIEDKISAANREVTRCEKDFKIVPAKELKGRGLNGPRLFISEKSRQEAIKSEKENAKKATLELKDLIEHPERSLLPTASGLGAANIGSAHPDVIKAIAKASEGIHIQYNSKAGAWGMLTGHKQGRLISKDKETFVVEIQETRSPFKLNESRIVTTRYQIPGSTKGVVGKSVEIAGVFVVKERQDQNEPALVVLERLKFDVKDLIPAKTDEVKK